MKISVVTVCKNAEKSIRNTIESVLSQKNADCEYWIIDGASNDSTLDIIKEYSGRLCYISEEDKGISDAFNKGIEKVCGGYLLFLNSGDCFVDENVLSYVGDKLEKTNSDIYSFNVKMSDGTIWFKDNDESYRKWDRSIIPHQGSFIKKSVFNKVGLFDLRFKVRMDYDFFKRCFLAGCTYKSDLRIIVNYDMNGISSRNLFQANKEGLAVRLLYDNKIEDSAYIELLKMLSLDVDLQGESLYGVLTEIRNISGDDRNKRQMFEKYFWCFNKWMFLRNRDMYVLDHPDLKNKSIAVYGFGKLGKRLIEDIEKSGGSIEYAIDKNAGDLFARFPIYTDKEALPECDVLIVSLIFEFEEIKNEIEKYYNGRIMSLETIIDDLWKGCLEKI